jgi:hypothetical protein
VAYRMILLIGLCCFSFLLLLILFLRLWWKIIMTVNCHSIKGKGAEFETALLYLKPDIICATQSLLRGVKPGVNPTKDTIKSLCGI